jgi:hypothetical protein
MILRFNRDTKASAFFRNEIDKFVRKSRVKKKNKDKISALRDSSMRDSRSFRDFVFESESQSESSSQFELVVDSFIVVFVAFVVFVVSIAFVASIVSISIDNATLLEMFLQLLFFSFDTIFFRSILLRLLLRFSSRILFDSIRLRLSLLFLLSRLWFSRWSKSSTIWTWTTSTFCYKSTIVRKRSCFETISTFMIKIAFKKKFKFMLMCLRSAFLFLRVFLSLCVLFASIHFSSSSFELRAFRQKDVLRF